jgi:adenylate cyclase
VARFVAELHREFMGRAWILPVALALALGLALVVGRSIASAVRQLVEGTERVAAGRYDRPVVVRTRDELRALAEAFNGMLAGLRERFAMLRFVPRHTRAVIAEAVRGGQAALPGKVAERREVAVLFSDIRGFTAMSERLPATRVIEILNVYLTREAEIIEAGRGSIDKFIGDAVMAVFEGPTRFADAVASALQIQAAIGELNRSHAFDETVEVGIGVAGGEVVMGAVGYEGRAELAVIGRRVNLASRLCGVAGRGEVVVSDEAFRALDGAWRGEERKVKLKGFADEVACFRVEKPVDAAMN